METLVLLRHGQSEWNRDGRFAGWIDVALTPVGIEQARRAALFLRQGGHDFDRCYTSVLERATRTAAHCLEAMERRDLPTESTWRLNERHYGALHGQSKDAIAKEFGQEQLRAWRRDYATRPPPSLPAAGALFQRDARYAGVPIPDAESQADTVRRVSPFWRDSLRPALGQGLRCLVVAHGTSLRALVKIVCGMSGADIERLEIPNCAPLLIEFEASGRGKRPYCLHD
jgi:2,3-bisphosphoglycerate-dependent phosphoglycerate mutase